MSRNTGPYSHQENSNWPDTIKSANSYYFPLHGLRSGTYLPFKSSVLSLSSTPTQSDSLEGFFSRRLGMDTHSSWYQIHGKSMDLSQASNTTRLMKTTEPSSLFEIERSYKFFPTDRVLNHFNFSLQEVVHLLIIIKNDKIIELPRHLEEAIKASGSDGFAESIEKALQDAKVNLILTDGLRGAWLKHVRSTQPIALGRRYGMFLSL